MGQTSYGTISIADITDTNTRLKYFFWPGDTDYPGVYAVGGTNNFDEDDISTYGYNVRLTPTTINIGYNEFPIIQVDGEHGSLNMFNLPYEKNNTLVQGKLGLKLDTNSLKVYKEISNSNSLIAEFSSYINIGPGHNNSNDGSAAIGVGLTTTRTNQIVVGRYNESNSNATFIIGDGTNSSNKSNLLTVGNIQGKQMTDTFVGDGSTGTFTLTNEPSQQPTISTSSGSYTITNWSGTTITLDSNLAADVVLTVTYNMLNSGGYLVLGDNNEVHGENALVCVTQGVSSAKVQASGNGSLIHGYASDSTMTASGMGSSIHGYASDSTMTASGMGSSIHECARRSTMTASGPGSSIYGYASNSTMNASYPGSSIYGFAANSTVTASSAGASIYGYASNSSTMNASHPGSSIHGYASNSTMTASGPGSSIHGYARSSTMTASGAGSIALNESTHALKRAQLAIGTFNEDDTASTTIHPSNNDDYGKYAFIIGNGTGENARTNASTVDWLGNLWTAGTITGLTEEVDLTSQIGSDFTTYNTSSYTTDDSKIRLRRFGNVISITGIVKPTSSFTGDNTAHTICLIPSDLSDWRPKQPIVLLMQGSTQYHWCLKIETDGTVTFSRYCATTSYANVSTSTWLPFHATWIV